MRRHNASKRNVLHGRAHSHRPRAPRPSDRSALCWSSFLDLYLYIWVRPHLRRLYLRAHAVFVPAPGHKFGVRVARVRATTRAKNDPSITCPPRQTEPSGDSGLRVAPPRRRASLTFARRSAAIEYAMSGTAHSERRAQSRLLDEQQHAQRGGALVHLRGEVVE